MSASVPQLRIERVRDSRLPRIEDWAQVPFASIFTDHMLVAEYYDGEWRDACIRPYGPLTLSPAISALQYGVSVFEGLKAQRTASGAVALFRARENARRLNNSASRLAMPEVPEDFFLSALRELLRLDQSWVPPSGEGALYIRPGVTRDSVITLLRDMGWPVRERPIRIDEILAAHERGLLRECFGTGTAATLTYVRRIRHDGRDIELPPINTPGIGALARERLVAIATARAADPHGWLDVI
jgi:branched-subunit amino acid aminotransferase/4-amino-4-deoxychorismate lyase